MSLTDYDIQHWKNIAQNMRATQSAFRRLADRVSKLYEQIPGGHPFDLNAHPEIKRRIEIELRALAREIQSGMINGINNEWMLSNQKNDRMLNDMLGDRTLPSKLEDKWRGRNLSALEAFRRRKVGGLGLSDRVWNIAKGQGVNIERQLALGIYEGTPAKELASEMKQYLRDPDRLFRRVRDAEGNLKLSKAAKQYKPGRGRYRSAYKNALRLTRTEINMAYQKADNERWKDMDFITGIRVERSNAPYDCDICAAGVGDYPKDYEWSSFHPNCRCRAIPIRASQDEFLASLDAAEQGKDYQFSGQVKDIPDSFKEVLNTTNYTHHGH